MGTRLKLDECVVVVGGEVTTLLGAEEEDNDNGNGNIAVVVTNASEVSETLAEIADIVGTKTNKRG